MGNKHDILEVLGFSYHARGIMTPAFYYTSCSYKGCEVLSWVTNQIYWKYGGSSYHASGKMITAFSCPNCSYNGCESISWVTKIVIIQQGVILPWTWQEDRHTIKTPCLLPMIEIHTSYMSNLFNSTGGHSTMALVRRPPHYQDTMFVTHDRNSHPLFE